MMSATAPAKFRFDLDLGHRQERNSVLTETALAALVAEARAQGRSEGYVEGERSAAATAAQRIAQAAAALADHTATLSASLDDARHAMLADAVGLSATIGRKLASHLLAAAPAAEIEALIADCLATLDAVPHLLIRCAAPLADTIRDLALARISLSGFTGRLVVLGDPDLGLDDVRIEWADGGLVRDRASVEAGIEQRIAAFVAARHPRAASFAPDKGTNQ